jgi:DNA-directed RNA polymerase specialized sigma24 family protein
MFNRRKVGSDDEATSSRIVGRLSDFAGEDVRPEAFEPIYERIEPIVLSALQRLKVTGPDLDELAQESFSKLIQRARRARDRGYDPAISAGYVATIARSAFLERKRAEEGRAKKPRPPVVSRGGTELDALLAHHGQLAVPSMWESDAQEFCAYLIGWLSAKGEQRAARVLSRRAKGYSAAEIAERLNIPVRAVRQSFCRACEIIRDAGYGSEDF